MGGNFELPFQFQLPDQLPSSFHYNHDGYCSIRYKVKLDNPSLFSPVFNSAASPRGATLSFGSTNATRKKTSRQSWGGKSQNTKHEIHDILVQVLAKPPSSQPVPNLVEPVSTNIKLCCCIPKGKIIVSANVDDTRVGQGEEMKVDLGIKNNSTAGLEWVEAYIKQNISWHSGMRRAKGKTYLAESEFNVNHDNMRARSKNEMQGATMAGNANRSRGLDLSDDTFRELLAAVKDGSNTVIMEIAPSAINTYQGKLITVKHHLIIKAKTPFGSTNPTIKVPLQIVSPDSVGDPSHSHQEPTMPDLPPNHVAPPNPEGWNADNVTSVVPSAPSLHNTILYGGDVVDSEQEVAFELPPTGGGSPTYDYPISFERDSIFTQH